MASVSPLGGWLRSLGGSVSCGQPGPDEPTTRMEEVYTTPLLTVLNYRILSLPGQ